MTDAELSFVIQGPLLAPPHGDTLALVAALRRRFPGAEVIVSTWVGQPVESLAGAARVVQSVDPGPAAGIPPKATNIHRLVTSTSAGLAACTRPFAVKLRSDAQVHAPAGSPANPLAGWPRLDETRIGLAVHSTPYVPYFLDDKTQLGPLRQLQRFWHPETAELQRPFGAAARVVSPARRAFLFAQPEGLATEQALFLRYCGLELAPDAEPRAWVRTYLDAAREAFVWLNAPRLGFGSRRFTYQDRPGVRAYLALMNWRATPAQARVFHALCALRAFKHRRAFGPAPGN